MRIVAGVDCQKSSHTVGDQRGQRSLPDDPRARHGLEATRSAGRLAPSLGSRLDLRERGLPGRAGRARHHPRWTGENRPFRRRVKPAIAGR